MTYEDKLAADGVLVDYPSDRRGHTETNGTVPVRFYRRFSKFERGWDNKERMVTARVYVQ